MINLFEDSGITLTLGMLLILIVAAFLAGWVDAVVGGGGLIQLPALLLFPVISPVQALATNKLSSVFGTAISSVTYYKEVRPSLKLAAPAALAALVGAFLGAGVANILPGEIFLPIIIAALVVVLFVTVFRPALGTKNVVRFSPKTSGFLFGVIGLTIGFYDGVLGPGTGTFFIFAISGVIGLEFLQAGAYAKILNFVTNLGALLLFIPVGAVMWKLGLIMAIANMVGSFIGSKTAISKGNKFIKTFLIIMVLALLIRLFFFRLN